MCQLIHKQDLMLTHDQYWSSSFATLKSVLCLFWITGCHSYQGLAFKDLCNYAHAQLHQITGMSILTQCSCDHFNCENVLRPSNQAINLMSILNVNIRAEGIGLHHCRYFHCTISPEKLQSGSWIIPTFPETPFPPNCHDFFCSHSFQISQTLKRNDKQILSLPWRCAHYQGTNMPCPLRPAELQMELNFEKLLKPFCNTRKKWSFDPNDWESTELTSSLTQM